jgi:hypothetical protein
MVSQEQVTAIWDKVVEQVKLKVMHPTLWRSLEISIPVTVEGTQFVVGFPPGSFHMSGNLTSGDHRNAIERALREFTGIPLQLRIIEGDSIEDWEHVKYKDQSLEAIREKERKKRDQASAVSQSWDNLLEQIGRRYANLHLRQLPQARAKYIGEMVRAISDAMDELMPTGSSADELAERSLARAIDRVGQLSETPPTLIALELQRFREGVE